MNFNYANNGDSLYKVETYNFRYDGRQAAVINLQHLLDEDTFNFEIQIDEKVKLDNNELRTVITTDSTKQQLIGVEPPENNSSLNSREAALQLAIDWVSKILEEYSDRSVKREKKGIENL